MILAALALLAAQTTPAPAQDVVQGEDIVVRATFGHTTMLFDKGADGRLYNCRIMVSSGSQKRDTNACQATPVCYAKTADEVTDCVDLVAVVPVTAPPSAAPGAGKPVVFDMPQLVKPGAPPSPNLVGPTDLAEDSRETERQRVKKIAPPVNPASGGPVIRVTAGNTEDQRETRP